MALARVTQQLHPLLSAVFIIWAVLTTRGNYGVTVAQSPSPSSGCATSLVSLSPCLGFITTNITTSPPSQSCCTALSSVVNSSATCLCQLFTPTNPLGVPINTTRALALPGACKITTPPLTQCNGMSNGAAPPTSPNAVSPSGDLQPPSGISPTNSNGGISPAGQGSEGPTFNAGAAFTPSTVTVVIVGLVVVSTVW